jgi:integrase
MSLRLTEKFLGGDRGPSKGALPKGGKAQVDHWDIVAPGLGVRVTDKGRRSFVVWYRHFGKARRDTLKPQYPALSLEEARREAEETSRDIQAGRDPRLSGRDPRAHYAPNYILDADTPESYVGAVDEYIRRYQKGSQQNRSWKEVDRALLKFGENWDLPISDITARDIRAKLEAIRDGGEGNAPAPYMANRSYSYLRTFFSWCAEPGIEIIENSPMGGMKKPWNGEASRDRVFNDDEIAAIWKAADVQKSSQAGTFVKMLLLTGKRKGALAAMRWSEIDENGLWVPPQDLRIKRGNKRLHAIPIPALGLRIIQALPKVSDSVFPGRNVEKPFLPGSKLQKSIQKSSGVEDFFFHGLRHTMETGLAELRVPPHVRDIVLDHAPARGAGAGYDHHHYRDEMSEALEAWSDQVQKILVEKNVWNENIIQMRG